MGCRLMVLKDIVKFLEDTLKRVELGETDILVDAGSRKNSAPVIKNYLFVLNNYNKCVLVTYFV